MMARSAGEAIATGLESGIGLAMRMDQNKRAIAADARAEERLNDAQRRQGVADKRQASQDAIAADTAQLGMISREVQSATDAGLELPPARQLAIGQATKEINSRMNRAYADMGGADIEAITKEYDDAEEGLKNGKIDASTLAGPKFGAVFTQATGHALKAFMRGPASEKFPNGEPSQIEQAVAAVQKGIEGGDEQSLLSGLNVMLKPNIDRIRGKPSAHGGVIIGAEIAGLYDDPNAPKDDPRMVPMLKIMVRDESAMGPAMENGATGWYMAPVTEGRETGGDAKIKSISTTKGMDWIGKNLELVEALNTPEGRAKVQEAYATPGMTPEDWQAVKAQLGVKRPKKTIESKTTAIGPNGLLVQDTDTTTGRTTERVVSGTPKPAKESAAADLLQAKLAEIEADGDMSPAEKKVARRAVLTGIKPGKYTGGAAGGAAAGGGGRGGGAASSSGLTAAENRLAQRKLDTVKADIGDLDKRMDNARAEYELVLKRNAPSLTETDAQKAAREKLTNEAEQEYKKTKAEVSSDRAKLVARKAAIQDQLDEVPATRQSEAKPGKNTAPAKTKAGATVSNW